MLAFSPPVFSTIGCPLEEPISLNLNCFNIGTEASEYLFISHQFSSPQPQVEAERSTPSPATSSDPTMVKKLNHNASERNRRKNINALYSSLRSLLPVADQMKKLSISATISQVLNYIPELQQQVEGLSKKKEDILLRISQQGDAVIGKESQRKISRHNFGFVVSTSRLNDSEAAIQISSYVVNKIPLYEILLCLESDGLVLLNASSTETFEERVFYNLHFQVDKTQILESEILSKKLLSIIKKKEGIFQSNEISYIGHNDV